MYRIYKLVLDDAGNQIASIPTDIILPTVKEAFECMCMLNASEPDPAHVVWVYVKA